MCLRVSAVPHHSGLIEAGMGVIHGTRYGIALDSLPLQYGSGEVEAAVFEAYEAERPEVIVIEGLGPPSHPAYLRNQLWAELQRPAAGDEIAIRGQNHAGRSGAQLKGSS